MTNRRQRRQSATQDKAVSTNDGFANFSARMGMGAENVFSQGTYLLDLLTRNRLKLEAMYRGSWIVGAAVDSIAEDMTRAGINIKGRSDPEQIGRMQAMLTRQGIWAALLDAIKWGRLYGGAVAMIVIDGQDTASPLRIESIGKGQFKGLRVFDRWQLQPSLQDIIQDGMDVGLPMFYDVVSDVTTGRVSSLRIHHSRIIRQIGIQLPAYQAVTESMWGESVIERMNDRLIAFDTATAGAANLIQKAHLRTVQIENLREVLSAGGMAEENLLKMFHHMRMLQTSEGLTLLDKNDSFTAHSYTFSGLSDMILQFGQQIAGATGIPLVRLFGQSPAGLSATGESDLRMYYDNVAGQQESRLRDGLLRLLRVMHQSMFGTPAPEEFDFDFVPLWQTSMKEKADIALTATDTVIKAFDAGIIDQPTAMQELKQASATTGIFSNIDDADIEAAQMDPPMPMVEGGEAEPVADKPETLGSRLVAWVKGNA